MPTNYNQLFAIQSKYEKVLRTACPKISNKSGIYFLTREENGEKYFYIGKGLQVMRRMCSHLMGYQQRIDISLRKRGFYSPDNELGWKLNVLYFDKSQLDEKERFYIDMYLKDGQTTYNIESGGSLNKSIIGERKAPKNYRDGLNQGYVNAQREVSKWFNKSLDYSIKGKPNKHKEKTFAKFTEFLKAEDIGVQDE